jgi:2-polyprenyl-6-hydroxyphenyl methylase/3-demethylubiquinone-9 3-methyltransferase
VNKAEIDLFDKLSTQWWDPYGPSAMLHRMNPARVSFIKDCLPLAGHGKKLNEYRVLDIGCGAGILTEVILVCLDLSL